MDSSYGAGFAEFDGIVVSFAVGTDGLAGSKRSDGFGACV